MDIRIINEREVVRLLPMPECIDAMDRAFRALASGDAVQPLRNAVWLPDRSGLLGMMPGFLPDPVALGIKIVTVFPGNHGTAFDSHQGAVLLFDVARGSLLAVMDAASITAIRTAAASAVATRLLARDDCTTLAILGSGVQARTHVEAMSCVHDLSAVRIWSRSRTSGAALAAAHESHPATFTVHETAADAVREADIICTVTSSNEPVLEGAWVAPGTHINAVGACLKFARELDSAAVAKARLFVDWRESTVNESGDFLFPKNEGLIGDDHIVAEVGELLLGRAIGRTNDAEITLFKSLGVAAQDLAAAHHIYERACTESAGTVVPFGGPDAHTG